MYGFSDQAVQYLLVHMAEPRLFMYPHASLICSSSLPTDYKKGLLFQINLYGAPETLTK